MLIGTDEISIHALREEGDGVRRSGKLTGKEFLSTPSARRATNVRPAWAKPAPFLSTPSARRATTGAALSLCA